MGETLPCLTACTNGGGVYNNNNALPLLLLLLLSTHITRSGVH
jgi:hypothetical protein